MAEVAATSPTPIDSSISDPSVRCRFLRRLSHRRDAVARQPVAHATSRGAAPFARGQRVVGYCCDAERLRAALPYGYWLERASPFALTPPADCPYVSEAAGDRCFVAVIDRPRSRRALDVTVVE